MFYLLNSSISSTNFTRNNQSLRHLFNIIFPDAAAICAAKEYLE